MIPASAPTGVINAPIFEPITVAYTEGNDGDTATTLLNSTLIGILLRRFAESIEINEGDMMKISPSGVRETSQFSLHNLYAYGYYGYPYRRYLDEGDISEKQNERSYTDALKSMAHTFGYTAEDVDTLLSEGFTLEDIEDFFYEGVYC